MVLAAKNTFLPKMNGPGLSCVPTTSESDDNPLEADELNIRGDQFLKSFRDTGDDKDIGRAITAYKQAAACLSSDDPRLGEFLHNIGIGYLKRYDSRLGELDDLQTAIPIIKKAIAVTLAADEHAHLPGQLNNLGISFRRRFERTGDLDDISEAVQSQQCAVQLTPEEHPNLPALVYNLGTSFSRRFKHTGHLDDLSEAIQNQQRAIQLTPDGHPDLPTWVNDLGNSFLHRFGRTGDLDGDLSQAIRNQQCAVQLTPDGDPGLPARLNNLGTSFCLRFEHTRDMDDLSEAIRNLQSAVQLSPDGHSDLPALHSNLGNSFSRRFERTGDLDDLSEAIRNQQRAVQLTPPDRHLDLAAWLNNLGNSFCCRFEYTGHLDDLSEAIRNQQRAVQLTPDGHPSLPGRLNNLGNSFSCRFEHTGHLDDISEAIRNSQRAVELTPDGHPSLQVWLNNLGNSFSCRFESTGDLDDISEAIRNQQSAVRLSPDGHPDLPALLHNLATSFSCRFERTGDLDDLSEAIRNSQWAVQLIPYGHPNLPALLNHLGSSFSLCFERTGAHEFLSTAVLSHRLSATSPTGPPSVCLMTAKQWVALSQQSPSPSSPELLEAHACIIRLLSLISGFDNTVERRHEALVDSSQLSLAASAAALSQGRHDKALEWLVEGRCLVWNQINQLRTPLDRLRSHDPALAEHLSAVSQELENAGSRSESERSEMGLSFDDQILLEKQAGRHIRLAKERNQLLATIRNITGFEDFLQPRKCADIMRRLPDEGAVVIVNTHNDRCDALALVAGADKPMHIPLPKFSYQEAERLAKGLRGHLLRHGVVSRIGIALADDDDPPLPDIDLAEVLSVLWSQVVWPILESLAFNVPDTKSESCAKLPRVWWCPTGPLAFLPIHAAGIYVQSKSMPKQCLSDFAVSSYIPTVNALFETSESNCGDAPTGLLIVSQPNTPKKTEILGAADETKKVAKQLEKRGIPSITLGDQSGTVEAVLKAMESFPSIHLACHASQNTTSPLKSSIYLHDGPLELSEIMKKNLRYSNFAFLSACQTSTGDKNLPEEVVHLAAGMLAAGYRSVVGTMWSISDTHGADLAEFFYKSLLDTVTNEGSKIDGARAARALHRATKRLREKISDSPDSLLVWVPYIHIGV